MNTSRRNSNFIVLLYFCIFIFILIWFGMVHPLIVFDGDDWTYISFFRDGIPRATDWNPSRIFPETFMAIPSAFAVQVLYPITGDYIGSFSMVYAFTASVFVTVYAYLFGRLLKNRLNVGNGAAIICIIAFLLFHFSLLKANESDNSYMFWSKDTTCFFYYTLSSILNCSLVFYFAEHGLKTFSKEKGKYIRKGIILLLVYLAVFSNMYSSIILVLYISSDLLFSIIKSIKGKQRLSIRNLICNYWVSILIICLWLISIWFESRGGRASYARGNNLQEAIRCFSELKSDLNKITAGLCILFHVGALAVWFFRRKNEENHTYIKLVCLSFICAVVSSIYLILLSSRVDPAYLKRADAIYPLLFFVVFSSVISLGYIVRYIKAVNLLIPFVLFLVLCNTSTGTHIFKESTVNNVSPKKSKQISSYIYDRVIENVNHGESDMVIKVPCCDGGAEKWPLALWMGDRIAHTLQKEGIIDKSIQITVVADRDMNTFFDVP